MESVPSSTAKVATYAFEPTATTDGAAKTWPPRSRRIEIVLPDAAWLPKASRSSSVSETARFSGVTLSARPFATTSVMGAPFRIVFEGSATPAVAVTEIAAPT
eukprot:Amastigsp_a8263_3.p4 type:complete len:103 gc:universal Amastigsp_a8263_3:1508-1200(-)